MGKKPSYEELEQRVKTLENEALECNNLEEMYRVLVEHSLQGIVIIQDARIAFANTAFTKLSGYTIDELLSLSPDQVSALIHPDDQALVWGRLQARLEGKPVPPRYEYRGMRKDGTVCWFEMVTSRIELLGKFAIQGSIIDVTERKHAEDALRENKEELELIFHGVREGIAIFDKTGKIIRINKRIVDVGGYSEKEIINKRLAFLKMFPRKSIIKMARNFTKLISGEITACFEVEVYTKTGKKLDVELQGFPLRKKNKIIGMMGVIRDITERKRMETTIKESESQKETILDSLVEHVIHQDMDMKIQWANHAACESAGMTREELIGRYCYEIWPQRSDPCPDCPFRDAINTGQSQEIEKITPDGRAWYIRGYPVRDQKDSIVGGTELTLEITEHRLAEEALEKSEERYRSLFDRLPLGVFRSTPDGQFLDANPAFTRLLRCPDLSTLLKTPATTFYREPEKREEWKKLIEKGDDFAMEVQWQTLDGSPIWVHESARAVRDSQGRILYYEGVAEDITEIKRAEEKQKNMEAQLHQAQKMESIGTLAGGIAHDFNNLLMGIQGNASLMLLKKDTSHPDYERLKYIEQHVQDGTDLTKQLLGFARGGKYDAKPTDLNDIIKKNAEMFGRTKKEITIHTKYQDNIWPAEVDRGQIGQALLNLYVNAWQAMPAGGNLYLETRNVTIEKDYVKTFDIRPGKYIKIAITDTGVGMDKKTQQRIFEPFFTTKEMGRGTGLGLASVYGMIKNHGGHIAVSSKKSEGTTFTIYLPASDKNIIEEERGSDTIKRGTETILLVDDEDMIVNVGSQMLKKLGYEVLAAGNGKEAIDIYTINKDRVQLVILDMIMPILGGGETYDRMKKINPNIKVLLSSGYSIDGQASEILKRGCDGFIQKPFAMKELSQRIREIIDKE